MVSLMRTGGRLCAAYLTLARYTPKTSMRYTDLACYAVDPLLVTLIVALPRSSARIRILTELWTRHGHQFLLFQKSKPSSRSSYRYRHQEKASISVNCEVAPPKSISFYLEGHKIYKALARGL